MHVDTHYIYSIDDVPLSQDADLRSTCSCQVYMNMIIITNLTLSGDDTYVLEQPF